MALAQAQVSLPPDEGIGFVLGDGVLWAALKRPPTRRYLMAYAQRESFPTTVRADVLVCTRE